MTTCIITGMASRRNPTTQLKTLVDLPRIEWRSEFAADPIPHLVKGYMEHGPVFGLDTPNHTPERPGMVFIIGPEANRLAYTDIETFWWGPIYSPLKQIWGPTIITMDGDEHHYWRRLMQPTVTGRALAGHLDAMRVIIERHVSTWADNGPIDVFEATRNLIFEVAARIFCSIDDPAHIEALRDVYVRLGENTTNPFEEARFDFDPDAADEIRAMLKPLISEARRSEAQKTALELLANTLGDDGKDLDEDYVVANVFLLLLAGHETSAILTSWILWLLGSHSDVSAKVGEEIGALPDHAAVQLLRGSDYISRVLMEAERLYPPLPITGRALQDDVEFAGFHLPKGLFVQLSAGASHRLPDVFNDPDTFDPDRFAPSSEERKTPYSLIGFAGGRRVCLGQPFAKAEIAEILVQIYHRYDFRSLKLNHLRMRRGATTMPGEPVMIEFTPKATS